MSAIWSAYRRGDEPLLEHLMRIRGLTKSELEPQYQKHLHDPFLLPDMERACKLLVAAQKAGERVVVFGDYDADGTPAAAVLYEVFERIGLKCEVILPKREIGYGLRPEYINDISSKASLLLTVDTGITAVDEISLAKKRGLKVIVLDHHLPGLKLPAADALVDPFVAGSRYPFPQLCACALAYKLAVALGKFYPDQLGEKVTKWLLDLVAISTVADMMPIIGENRALVHYGLIVLRKNRRLGLRRLIEAAGLSASTLDEGSLGFALGPRLNASGRLGDNRPAFDLLVAKDDGEAKRLAELIENTNRKRQQLVTDVYKEAEAQVWSSNSQDDRILVLRGDSWPSGVLGLVAGRIAGKYNRPALVVSVNSGLLTGSARSVEGYSIADALQQQSALLVRHGGHNQAAGVTLEIKNWDPFVAALKKHAHSQIAANKLQKRYVADAVLAVQEVGEATIDSLQRLQPFGHGNNRPLFVVEGVALDVPRRMGVSGNHLKWKVEFEKQELEVIGFDLSERFLAAPLDEAHLLGFLEYNEWQGTRRIQFRLVDFCGTDQQIELINISSTV